MEYPLRDVAAFKSLSTILYLPTDFCISAWMWVFTRLWRSDRPAVAWWILITLIRSPSCVITQATLIETRPWAMCSSTFFLGVYAKSQQVLWGGTQFCAESWPLWYAFLCRCIHHLALCHCPYLLLSQFRCVQQCNIRTLDTSTWILADLLSFFLRESGSPAALRLLPFRAWPVQCKVAPHVSWYQVVPDSIKSHYLLQSFAAAISDTIPMTIVTAIASNLIMSWDLFVFHFFPLKNLNPIMPLERAHFGSADKLWDAAVLER